MGKPNTKKDIRRTYSKEFKLKVVKEHVEGLSLTELSRIYAIAPSTLGTWFANMKDEVEASINKESLNKESLDKEDDIIVDTDLLEEVQGLKDTIKKLMLQLTERDLEIERLTNKLQDLPKEGETWENRVEDLAEENTRLENEVNNLHRTLATVKEEARREILTLKEAILIMAKHHEEEY